MASNQNQRTFRVWHVLRGTLTLKGTVTASDSQQAKAKASVLWFLPVSQLQVAP